MQYIYNQNAGSEILKIEGDLYRYLFRVRREKIGSIIEFRNLKDNKLYYYNVINIDKKEATLKLLFAEVKKVIATKELTLGWCIIDPKNIEKTLPSLNEIGVGKIVFIKCAYSQANYKIKKEKLVKILINSNQQCGRSDIMQIEFSNSLFDFLVKYPDSFMLNFSSNLVDNKKEIINSIVIGCEGGFSKDEVKLFKNKEKIVGFNSNVILQSHTAIVAAASKILL